MGRTYTGDAAPHECLGVLSYAPSRECSVSALGRRAHTPFSAAGTSVTSISVVQRIRHGAAARRRGVQQSEPTQLIARMYLHTVFGHRREPLDWGALAQPPGRGTGAACGAVPSYGRARTAIESMGKSRATAM